MLFLDFGQADIRVKRVFAIRFATCLIRLNIFHRHPAALIQMTVDQEQEYDC